MGDQAAVAVDDQDIPAPIPICDVPHRDLPNCSHRDLHGMTGAARIPLIDEGQPGATRQRGPHLVGLMVHDHDRSLWSEASDFVEHASHDTTTAHRKQPPSGC